MRVAIMGGTLDPVHNGHIQMAQAALEMLHLDRVMLLPAGDPPHKSNPIAKEDRMEMARLAAAKVEGVFPCSIEIERSGTTYTVDTLRQLRSMNPNVDWYYIIGADTLEVLDTWRNFGEVAKLCTFIVCGRAEDDANPVRMAELEHLYGAQFVALPFNGPDISSTDARKRVCEGNSIADIVPTSVCNYIKDRGLYLCGVSREDMLSSLKEKLRPGRYAHTLGVAETARRLAPRFGIDPARAELAALLHDCAKSMDIDAMRALVTGNIPDVDELELAAANVLHAPAGAVLAAQEYGVRDPQILSAIRKHTLGDAAMTPMDALIYAADFIEPNRKDFPGLAEARALAEEDIFQAARKCAELTNAHLESQGLRPHPKSIAMLNTIQLKK